MIGAEAETSKLRIQLKKVDYNRIKIAEEMSKKLKLRLSKIEASVKSEYQNVF